jgi:flagellar biosynthesis chaperone FliJ
MSYSNIDPTIPQLISQLLFLQQQIVHQTPAGIDAGAFIGALEDFVNKLGAEIQKQAE